MEPVGNFLLLLIRQFAGGPGPMENNLMRFGSAAIFWFALLIIAWSRQREGDLPRERLLIWGFGFAMMRELIMFGMTSGKIIGLIDPGWDDILYFPIENGLSTASVVVVTGAFLQFALRDELISRRYLQIGLFLTATTTLVSYITWPRFAQTYQGIHFSHTWESKAFHLLTLLLLGVGIFLLIRKRLWVGRVASIGLAFIFTSELIFLVSNWMAVEINHILCPISNAFHILAIPIFGFVYLKEMSLEKQAAEAQLEEYRSRLEDLIDERTAMLVAQHDIAESLSQSLDLETILNMALDKVLSVMSMDVGLLFLLDPEHDVVKIGAYRGRMSEDDLVICIREGCLYERLAKAAIEKQMIMQTKKDESMEGFTHINKEQIELVISAPLISKDQVIGALTIGKKNDVLLDETNLELLTAIGHQIGMAVQNAYLYQESEILAGDLSRLHQASVNLVSTLDATHINSEIAIQSSRLTGRPIACVIYSDESCEKIEIVSSVGLSEQLRNLLFSEATCCDLIDNLIATGKSIVINNLDDKPRLPSDWKQKAGISSVLCTPIWDVDEPVEFLFIFDTEENRSWRLRDVELVESFVSRAAVALENAHLYSQLEWAATIEERQRIAAEMHDGLAQSISLVGLKVDSILEMLPPESDGKLKEALQTTRLTVGQALVEARKSISSLHNDPQPKRSLQELLTALVEQWSGKRPADREIEVSTTFSFPDPLYLTSDQFSQILPIIQEAMINALKHSNATHIQLIGERYDNQIQIIVKDNGAGFNVDGSFEKNHHFGLKIMRARAERFGGVLQVRSDKNVGTIVTLSWTQQQDNNGNREAVLEGTSSDLVAE